jgi:CRP/FNR family cyclic AMP-dependent transcriptional regulator
MAERHFRKGDLLFAKGEAADEMFCTMTGRYVLIELGIEIQPGQVVGELAMLAPDNRRTATLECIEEGNVLSITYEQVEQLYYQNPTFGFYFLRLATARLFDNVSKMESRIEPRHAAGAGVRQVHEFIGISCLNFLCSARRAVGTSNLAALGCRRKNESAADPGTP